MKLKHYALNSPQGLNGWRDWLRGAIKFASNFIPFGSIIAKEILSVIDKYDNSEFQWRSTQLRSNWNNASSIPKEWEPTAGEDVILKVYIEHYVKPFLLYVESVFQNISNARSYVAQLQEYNNLVKSYNLYKNYHLTNEIQGLSSNAILAKIEVVDIFMKELSEKLKAIFNIDENTLSQSRSESFKAGNNISFGNVYLTATTAFTANFNEYFLKLDTVVIDTPRGPVVQLANNQSSTVEIPKPTTPAKPTGQEKPIINLSNSNVSNEKTELFGLLNFRKRPIVSLLTAIAGVYFANKLYKSFK